MMLSFHRNLRREFLDIAQAEPWRCAVIDASLSPEAVGEQVWSVVRERLEL